MEVVQEVPKPQHNTWNYRTCTITKRYPNMESIRKWSVRYKSPKCCQNGLWAAKVHQYKGRFFFQKGYRLKIMVGEKGLQYKNFPQTPGGGCGETVVQLLKTHLDGGGGLHV